MSGLDTSQAITEEVSLHAAEHHHHSRLPDPNAKAPTEPTRAGADPDAAPPVSEDGLDPTAFYVQ